MIPQETLRELTQLRQQVADLQAELALLRDVGNRKIERLVSRLGVTVGQARTINAMMQGVLTRDQALGLDLHRVDDSFPRALDSLIKHLRRRLPWLKIETIYGLGYEITDAESRQRIREALEDRQ